MSRTGAPKERHAWRNWTNPGQADFLFFPSRLGARDPSAVALHLQQHGQSDRDLGPGKRQEAIPGSADTAPWAAALPRHDVLAVFQHGKPERPPANDPGRTRTCNLWFRRPTPYPLGHRATWFGGEDLEKCGTLAGRVATRRQMREPSMAVSRMFGTQAGKRPTCLSHPPPEPNAFAPARCRATWGRAHARIDKRLRPSWGATCVTASLHSSVRPAMRPQHTSRSLIGRPACPPVGKRKKGGKDCPASGAWCSGITSASHAEGPGFKSQCVHAFHLHSASAALPHGGQAAEYCAGPKHLHILCCM